VAVTVAVVQTSAVGVGVAVDIVGTSAFQQVKLVGGNAGATTAIQATTDAPAADAVGLVVRQQGANVVSGTVQVANAAGGILNVSVSAVDITTTAIPAASSTGIIVAVKAGASVTAAVTGTVAIVPGVSIVAQASGTVSVSGTIPVTGTINQLNTVVTVLSTVNVAIVAGGAGGGSVTTTQAAQTGQLMWLAPTQTLSVVSTIATILGTQIVSVVPGLSVSAVVSGTVTINGGASVTIQQGASVSAVVSGTVSLLNIVPVTTAASVSVTGVPVWLNPTQQIAVSGLVGHSITGSVNIVSTAVVTLATGGTLATLLGTLPVTGTIQNVASISTILGTQIVTLATGGSVAALDVGRTNVLIILTSTSVGISGTTMPFNLYIGMSAPVAGTTSYVVPAGKTLRILVMNAVVQNSVTTSPAIVRINVLASTALPTWTSTVPVMAQVAVQAASATVGFSGAAVQVADIPAGATVGLAFTIGTSGASIVAAQAIGYLFPL